jgi:hypothetical protein
VPSGCSRSIECHGTTEGGDTCVDFDDFIIACIRFILVYMYICM